MPKDDDLSWLHEAADRLSLDDSERDQYLKDGMERLGYKLRESIDWDEPDSKDPKKPASMIGRRPAAGGRSAAGGGGQYGRE